LSDPTVAAEIEALGRRSVGIEGDLADRAAVNDAVARTLDVVLKRVASNVSRMSSSCTAEGLLRSTDVMGPPALLTKMSMLPRRSA
jgi:hypothetical protein